MDETAAHAAIEEAVRDSYGRLVAYLATRCGGDIAGAEDALGDALLAALRQWPLEGVPRKPEAWLLATGRRRLIDMQRRVRVRMQNENAVRRALLEAEVAVEADGDFPDERLRLLFVCAHPAIDPAARTPLMLQTVLGVSVERIASAFLASPLAMAQRLVRTKAKVRAAGIPFVVPGVGALPERLGFVLDAIYAAYSSGWQEFADGSLAREAIDLARMVARMLPDEAEARGLLSLLLHCEARRAARVDASGRYVPLPEQNSAQWNLDMIEEAETELRAAAQRGVMGRFQLEAAIQSVHIRRRFGGAIDWEAIALLYEALVRITPALGARIGRAVALGRARGAKAGLNALEELPFGTLVGHQPFWAARAELLAESGRTDEARDAYNRAIGLSESGAGQDYLVERRERLGT
jgi:RNA polymerase sigma-70 factor (ECF subfamily)